MSKRLNQWLGLHPLAAFTLRRIEARGWHVSVHLLNGKVEMHAVREQPREAHVSRCEGGNESQHQFHAAKLLAEAVGVEHIVYGGRESSEGEED